jgi:inner membrane protein
VVDAILTPAPANPLCWQGIVVSRRNDEYVLDVAFVSAAPGVTPAATCRLETTGASLGMGPPSPRSTPAVHFEGQHRAPLAELRHFARSNCHVAAFLRFARAPFWRERGESVLVGDLRYDRSASEGFAELEVPLRPANCPAWLPPWTPPRRALLETP